MAMPVVDLHLHTTASDGRLQPAELIRLVARRGLKVVSIADHDTVEGLAEAFEAAEEFPDLEVIPGVELSCDVPGEEVHLLGYFVDYGGWQFQEALDRFRNGRLVRARRMLEKLTAMGMALEWERVVQLAGNGTVGRPHIAQAMMEKGYSRDFREAFDKYIGREGPAYVVREKLTLVEAVKLVDSAGGLAVLAHPREILDLDAKIQELISVGLAGMEVYYKNYSREVVRRLKEKAETFGLVSCGGSDFHGLQGDEVLPGEVGPPLESVESLKLRWKEKARRNASRLDGEAKR